MDVEHNQDTLYMMLDKFIFKKLNATLSLILLTAGFTHLFIPNIYLKAMPSYIPFHYEIIIFTGVLELFFSVGLVFKPLIKITSKVLAVYFVLILPSHIHVSVNNISFFGITSSYLLWGRTLFQLVLIYWALNCRKVIK